MWPLSQGEVDGIRETFVAEVLADPASAVGPGRSTTTRAHYISRIVAGGFPVALQRRTAVARARWFDDYVKLVLERDVVDLSRVRQRAMLPRLLQRLAGQTGQLLDICEGGRGAVDGSLDGRGLHQASGGLGHLVETFCVGEIRKQLSWLPEPVEIGHWRTHDGVEVDLVIERLDGGVVAFEIKSDTRVPGKAFQALRQLRGRLGSSFLGGVVLYTGERSYTFDDRLYAIPIDRLWSTSTPASDHR